MFCIFVIAFFELQICMHFTSLLRTSFLKEDVITSLRDQSYISPLHETLHNIPASNRQMCPTITVIFSVLKDITPFEMVFTFFHWVYSSIDYILSYTNDHL